MNYFSPPPLSRCIVSRKVEYERASDGHLYPCRITLQNTDQWEIAPQFSNLSLITILILKFEIARTDTRILIII